MSYAYLHSKVSVPSRKIVLPEEDIVARQMYSPKSSIWKGLNVSGRIATGEVMVPDVSVLPSGPTHSISAVAAAEGLVVTLQFAVKSPSTMNTSRSNVKLMIPSSTKQRTIIEDTCGGNGTKEFSAFIGALAVKLEPLV